MNISQRNPGLSGFEWPDSCGSFDFVIKKDGSWLYKGSPVGRKKLCQLFAVALQKDEQGYWLVTPNEKGKIEVEDAPFFVVEMDIKNVKTIDEEGRYLGKNGRAGQGGRSTPRRRQPQGR